MMIHSPYTDTAYPAMPCPGGSYQLAFGTPVFLQFGRAVKPHPGGALNIVLQCAVVEAPRGIYTREPFGLLLPFSDRAFYLAVAWGFVIACWVAEVAWILLGSVQG